MKISSAFPSNYLKAGDLQGNNVTVNISHVTMEDIGGDHKPVLYFQGKEKGMVLNKTNANNIAEAYGDDTDGWGGNPIVLFTAWVDFQGKSVEAIRCRRPQPKDMGRQVQSPNANVTNGRQDMPEHDEFGPTNGGMAEDSIPF